jgi:hypothetical protein
VQAPRRALELAMPLGGQSRSRWPRKAETSRHDARQTDVKKTKEVVEAPQDAGKEEEQPELQTEREEPQRQP